MTIARFFGVALAGAALALPGARAEAQDTTDVRFALDWAWQAMHGPFLIALEKGYYADEGLNVTIDRGFGSGDTINKVASGAYDVGFAEGTGLFKFNQENPDDAVISVLIINDQSPTGAISLKESGINTPQDLVGKKVSATQNEATVLAWPVLAELNDIDPDSVEFMYVEPNLRDALVIQGAADATFGFATTTALNFVLAGVDKDDVNYFTLAQFGLNPYSSGIIVRKDYAEENPEVVKGFVAATVKGIQDMLTDPAEGLALLKQREPLVDEEVEAARWDLAVELSILTPSVAEKGISEVDPERFEAAAKQIATAYGIEVDPKVGDYYDGSFLPPLEDRQVSDEAKARLAN
ncbi:ABC transporter substrate-binding protein [Acuticoccus sp. M5D2P5]|uniref:ABC transporter substrate-binding protein n=1 Tax=Acuticoccus kalidii TaxID=2910977 RepID=UPI001F2F3F42|nr:ABC transporter substrate-binding protein [Acuticoccus kalidii]MCF3933527.1 ABC transporter substrate-binding protein [Acuticoccus kalidii]